MSINLDKVDKKELFSLIKEAIREVLREEKFDSFLRTLIPVSKEEMKDRK